MKRFALATMMTAALLLPAMHAEDKIADRKDRQQGRIAQGVASGQLTPRETANLETREKNLNTTIRNDRAANGGHLTAQEKNRINNRQNNISHKIYRDKHNGATQK